MPANPASRERYVKAAERYAKADRSDPWALARALAHIEQGICGYVERGETMVDALYDATPHTELRKMQSGETYPVTIYGSVVRP
jgi:hypothetical protein